MKTHFVVNRLDNQRTCAAELMVMETRVPEPDFRHQDYNETRQLIGPYSPLEMKMYGKVHSLLGFGVKIEDDSVNSVLLDDQPGDSHERVLVAGQVGTKMDRKSVIVRSTTLLPNIPGLPAILTLLFAPRAEFRADDDRKCLTGAICGLGYDKERSQSFYPEHDMEIGFDAEIGLTVNFEIIFCFVISNFIKFYIFYCRMCYTSTSCASGSTRF